MSMALDTRTAAPSHQRRSYGLRLNGEEMSRGIGIARDVATLPAKDNGRSNLEHGLIVFVALQRRSSPTTLAALVLTGPTDTTGLSVCTVRAGARMCARVTPITGSRVGCVGPATTFGVSLHD
jgi:hypothetical protein